MSEAIILSDFLESKKTIEWLKLAANWGDINAKYELAFYYLDPDNVEFNEEEGLNYLQQIADQGDIWALYKMAMYYLNNENYGEMDLDKGMDYLHQAAEKGLLRAQEYLGKVYFDGIGVEQNLAKAEYWLRRAAEQTTDFSELLLTYLDEMHIPYKEVGFNEYALIN